MIHKWCLIGSWFLAAGVVQGQREIPKPVVVVKVERAPVESVVELTGSIMARRQASLSARTAGLIANLKVDAGDVVRQGDVVMELDDELARIAMERAAVEVEQAEIEAADAARLEQEGRDLAKTGGFPRSEAATRETALKLSRTALMRSRILLKEQQALVERHRLVVPFDGIISAKLAEEGEWVETGTPVVELVEQGNLRMDVQVPQEMAGRFREDPEITIRLDAWPEKPLEGRIGVIVPIKDAVARTFLTRILFEDPEGLAASGMSGRVVFTFRGKEPVLQVPRDSVIRFPDGSAQVWIVENNDGKQVASARKITPGPSLTDSIVVREGLEPGATVVLLGNEGLREGQPVKPVPAAGATPAVSP